MKESFSQPNFENFFLSNVKKGAIYMFRKELKSVMTTEIKVLSIDDTYYLLVCLQL
jgi:hypothetical protein